jgi:hypothetical protein
MLALDFTKIVQIVQKCASGSWNALNEMTTTALTVPFFMKQLFRLEMR